MTADVGGAARIGRMVIPEPIDIDTSKDDDFSDDSYEFNDEVLPESGVLKVSTDPRIAMNSVSERVLYPEMHPAIMPGVELSGTGAIVLKKDNNKAISRPNHDRSIDIVKDPRGTFTPAGNLSAVPDMQNARAESESKLDSVLCSMAEEPVKRPRAQEPTVEIMFHTDIGTVITHCHCWTKAGRWFVLGYDSSMAVTNRFIPRAQNTDSGAKVIELTVKDSDTTFNISVVPVDMNFGMFGYDFTAMLISEE